MIISYSNQGILRLLSKFSPKNRATIQMPLGVVIFYLNTMVQMLLTRHTMQFPILTMHFKTNVFESPMAACRLIIIHPYPVFNRCFPFNIFA